MVAADDWVIGGTVVAVLILFATLWLVALERRKVRPTRKQRLKDKTDAAEKALAQAAQTADAALVGSMWHFEFRLRVAVGDAAPKDPPIEITIKGANVWVHDVRLTWRPSEPALAYWVTKDEPCPPWGDGSLPYELNSGGPVLRLGWPGPNPVVQEQIIQKIKVKYSVLREGPQHEREADGGTVGWQ